MTWMRAAGAFLSITIALLTGLVVVPSARSQEDAASLTLVSQSPWNTLKDPMLEVSVKAQNAGDAALEDLTVGVTIGAAVRSRNAYEASLTEGPDLPIFASTTVERGSLGPGAVRRFDIEVDLSTIGGVSTIDSLVYPMRVDLRSASIPVAEIDSPAIVLVREPEKPLLLSWTIELTGPVAFDPEGRVANPVFEEYVGRTGSLGAEVDALRRLVEARPAPLELVVEPALLEQLQRMADGYARPSGSKVREGEGAAARADELLEDLRDVAAAGWARVTALPFAGSTAPSLIGSGLSGDLPAQLDLGDETVREILGVEPSTEIARPTDGALSEPALAALADRGIEIVLGNADTVERPLQPNEFAPPPSATLEAGGRIVTAVLPDPGTQGLLESGEFLSDPVRRAQAILGELATIWREQPVPDLPRGVAVTLRSGLQPGFWNPFLRRVADAPFLDVVPADELIRLVPPPAEPGPLAQPSTSVFSHGYVEGIKRERRDVAAYRSMVPATSPIPDRLTRNLFYAEAAEYLFDETDGGAWVNEVNRATGDAFARATPDTSQVFTFTSRTGTIPLRMGDPGPTPLTVILELRSAQFRFPDGDRQTVTLSEPDQIVTFRATATTTGQSQIQVIVRAPSGRPIQQQVLVVRTTAVNRIALIITVGAALVLVALWSRRYIRRPTA
jgi:hypothetical protein